MHLCLCYFIKDIQVSIRIESMQAEKRDDGTTEMELFDEISQIALANAKGERDYGGAFWKFTHFGGVSNAAERGAGGGVRQRKKAGGLGGYPVNRTVAALF